MKAKGESKHEDFCYSFFYPHGMSKRTATIWQKEPV